MAYDDVQRSQPERLRVRSLTPSLTVSDLQASLAWYRDVVGFHVKESYDTDGVPAGYELLAGDQLLFISQDDFAKGRDRVKGLGMRFFLETAQDIDTLADAIKARGGTLASEPAEMPWGPRAFSLVDPDGFTFTITATE